LYLRPANLFRQRAISPGDYGNRVGNWRLFEILDELKLPATILLNSSVSYHYPQIVEHPLAR